MAERPPPQDAIRRRPIRSIRQPQSHPQSAQRTVFETNVPAMCSGKVACQRQPESRPCDVLGAAIVQPVEWPERIFAFIRRDAWSIIIDQDLCHARALDQAHLASVTIANAV